MKIIIAQCSAAVPESREGHVTALSDFLASKSHQTQRLHLPSLAAPDRALANAVSFRLLGTGAADALVCLDPVAALLPHPRKIAWLLADSGLDGDPGLLPGECASDGTYLANVLRSAVGEASALFSPSKFALGRLHALGFDKARLLRAKLAGPAAPYARNPGPELLVLNPLEDRQRPELLVDCLAALPAPYRARWVASSAQPATVARLRQLAVQAGVEQRLAIDVRVIDSGEQAYLLAHAAALLELAAGEFATTDTVHDALRHGAPVIACTDGGALAEIGGTSPVKPAGPALAKAVLAARAPSRGKPSAPAKPARAGATGWAVMQKALSA